MTWRPRRASAPGARGVILLVLGGSKGSGFSCQATAEVVRMIPDILRMLADDIEFERAPPSFTCPQCGAVSHNLNDVKNRYCGRCHQFYDESGSATL